MSGFLGGYLLGAATDSTRRVYFGLRKSFAATAPTYTSSVSFNLLPYPGLTKFSQQSLQFHAHNLSWAREWAKISAVFGACRVLVKTIRHDTEDAWNSVFGSAMAGAILAGYPAKTMSTAPSLIARGALLYGGTMFLLHPDLWKQGMETCWLTPPRVVKRARRPIPVLDEFPMDVQEQHQQYQQHLPQKDLPWYDTIDWI